MEFEEISEEFYIERSKITETQQGHLYSVSKIMTSQDGKYVVSGSFDGTCRVWDPRSHEQKEVLFFLPETIEGLVISHDSRFIVAGCENSTLWMYDMQEGITKQILPDLGGLWMSGTITCSPVANLIAVLTYEEEVKIVNLEK
ncbi:MAG: WD40 repeat domain-containing protein, partial [Candidatus Hodarchaeales archaeon]